MREIEFRAKAIRTYKWVYGVPVKVSINCDNEYVQIVKKIEYETELEYSTFADGETIKPETIGQYTGLKDKNGTKIFGGDLLYYRNSNHDEEDGTMEVIFEDGAFMISGDILVPLHETYSWELEVVGNIHDNPEKLTRQHEDKGE